MRRRKAKQTPVPWPYIATGLVLLVLAAAFVRYAGPEFSAAVIQSEVIALTNTERVQNNVGVVTENALLDKAAAAKAADMAAKGYFAHVSPDGTVPWHWIVSAGYNYKYAGENLAVRFNDSAEVVNAWMASPTHRANIVKGQYTQIGVGIADGVYQGQPATFVVQYFASPAVSGAVGKTPVKKSSGLPSGAPIAAGSGGPDFSPSAPATAQPAVAGDEVAPPSWWQRVLAYLSTALGSLTASAINAEGGSVYIGDSGAATAR
ncbi:MAG: CAP domain-containing protein [Patescibacteria group bacterium]